MYPFCRCHGTRQAFPVDVATTPATKRFECAWAPACAACQPLICSRVPPTWFVPLDQRTSHRRPAESIPARAPKLPHTARLVLAMPTDAEVERSKRAVLAANGPAAAIAPGPEACYVGTESPLISACTDFQPKRPPPERWDMCRGVRHMLHRAERWQSSTAHFLAAL